MVITFHSAGRTARAAVIGQTGNEPAAIAVNQVHYVRTAMVDLASSKGCVRRPDYGDVVVNADERVIDALLPAFGTARDNFGKGRNEGVEVELKYLAIPDQSRGATWQQLFSYEV
jgi:hypothetical protein